MLKGIIEVKTFDSWGINFMGHFPPSNSSVYILTYVDHVSKLIEAISFVTNDAQTISSFLKKNVFARFRVPGTMISDGGHTFVTNA